MPTSSSDQEIEKLGHIATVYRSLAGTSEAISLAIDEIDLFRRVCDLLAQSGAFDAAAIFIVVESKENLLAAAMSGAPLHNFYAVDSDPLATYDVTSFVRLACHSAQLQRGTDRSRKSAIDAAASASGVFAVAVPIIHESRAIGALLLQSGVATLFDATLLRSLEMLARTITNKLDHFGETATQKENERVMVRLRNLFAALSATNEAILRTKAPDELYQRVCDAAVNSGKFTTTMILRPNLETGWMETQAITSVGEDMMRDYRISIDGSIPEGQGTAGIAYRTRRASLRNNMVNDPRMTA